MSVYRKQCRLHGCIIYGGDYGKTGGWLRWEVRYLNEYWLPFFVWAGGAMMSDWILGLGAFVMFFIYDWNRVFVKKKVDESIVCNGKCVPGPGGCPADS